MWVISQIAPALLEMDGPFRPKDLAEESGLEYAQTTNCLTRLDRKGVVERIGDGTWRLLPGAEKYLGQHLDPHALPAYVEGSHAASVALQFMARVRDQIIELIQDEDRFPMAEETRRDLEATIREDVDTEAAAEALAQAN